MASKELFCQLIGINPSKLSKEENMILEMLLFTYLCDELKKIFSSKHKDYFRLIKFNTEMEKNMLEENFLQFVINDILSTKEYSPEGIAKYTSIPEEIIYDIQTGKYKTPSIQLAGNIMELHKSVRQDLYCALLRKLSIV